MSEAWPRAVTWPALSTAAGLTKPMPKPALRPRDFCVAVQYMSQPEAAMPLGAPPKMLTPSTTARAPRALAARQRATTSPVTPVEVSLWVTATTAGLCASMAASRAATVAVLPGSTASFTAFLPFSSDILCHRSPNAPMDTCSTVSPSATRERTAASMAVDPEPRKRMVR